MAEPVKLISPTFSDLFEPNLEIGQFPDGDSHVRIPLLSECKNREVIIFHRLYPKQNTGVVALLFILDAVKNAGAKTVKIVVPYLPYARQDKQKLEGELLAANGLCRLLKKAGADSLITFDCHFLNAEGQQEFEGLPILNLSMGPELVKKAEEIIGGEDFEIIGPDDGSNYLVSGHGGQSMKKVRKEYDHGKIDYRDVHDIAGHLEVKGKNVLILDDMISSGSTMIKCLEKVTAAGAKNIACAATHGLFLFDCLDRLQVFTKNIFSSDSIENSRAMVSMKEKLTNL